METLLRANGIRGVMFGGCATDVCVEILQVGHFFETNTSFWQKMGQSDIRLKSTRRR